MAELRHAVKDSVFTYLFSQPEYTRLLYLSLHPEDQDVTEAEFKIVTLENVLSTGLYNDLGVQVRNRLLLLVEAQSTFSINIVLRLLLYLAGTYKEYVEEHKLDLYGTRPVTIPRPELYVIYTGSRKAVPDTLHLSDLYNGAGSVDLRVTVLRGGAEGDILSQYVRFCQIADENRARYGSTQKAVDAALRQCAEENILAPFLASRQKEVQDIMTYLFDHDTIMDIHDYNIAKEARQAGMQQGMKQGIHQGMKKGMETGISAMVSMMQEFSMDQETAARKLAAKFDLPPHIAREKVEQYWVGQ